MSPSPEPLRILAVLEGSAEGGGGTHQSVSALITLARVCDGRFGVEYLDLGGSHAQAISRAVADGRLQRLSEVAMPPEPTGTAHWLKRSRTLTARLARALLQVGDRKDDLAAFIDARPVDLVYFLHTSELAGRLRRRNVLTTVWDLCHRDFPEFPEVRAGGEFESRERTLRSHVTRAVGVIADSAISARHLADRYGVDPTRVLVMPFSPSPAMTSHAVRSTPEVLERHGLGPGYLFYPAQFWPHKNHVRLIEALAIRRREGHEDVLVLAGGDKGNKRHVLAVADRLGVSDQVRALGYVDDLDLCGLYEGSRAVVFASYFGPTNLPPLEAWASGRPLVHPAHLGEQVGDAAVLFDVDDAVSLAGALGRLDEATEVSRVVSAGTAALRDWRERQEQAEVALLAHLERLAARLANTKR